MRNMPKYIVVWLLERNEFIKLWNRIDFCLMFFY